MSLPDLVIWLIAALAVVLAQVAIGWAIVGALLAMILVRVLPVLPRRPGP